MSNMWAGPFLGEFGWECTVWAPWLRWQQHRLQVPLTVVCEEGKEGLYRDFAEETHGVEMRGSLRRDCQNAFTPMGGKLVREDYENICIGVAGIGVKCITPIDLQLRWPNAKRSRWHKYRREIDDPRNRVLIHARDHQHEKRNWSEAKWDELVSRLAFDAYDVMSIGSKDQAFHIDGTVDARGVTINDLVNYLSMADFIVGPSSGPMAFALLCETNTVWWSAENKDVPRFWKDWNPFDTAQFQVTKTWDPTVQEVYAACQKF